MKDTPYKCQSCSFVYTRDYLTYCEQCGMGNEIQLNKALGCEWCYKKKYQGTVKILGTFKRLCNDCQGELLYQLQLVRTWAVDEYKESLAI